jgi:hypothetical protein
MRPREGPAAPLGEAGERLQVMLDTNDPASEAGAAWGVKNGSGCCSNLSCIGVTTLGCSVGCRCRVSRRDETRAGLPTGASTWARVRLSAPGAFPRERLT